MDAKLEKVPRIPDGSYCAEDCPFLVRADDTQVGQPAFSCLWDDTQLRAVNVADSFETLQTHPEGIAVIRSYECRQKSKLEKLPVVDQMVPKYFDAFCGDMTTAYCPYVEKRPYNGNLICLRYEILLQREGQKVRRGNVCLKTSGVLPKPKAITVEADDLAALDRLEQRGVQVSMRTKAEAAGVDIDKAFKRVKEEMDKEAFATNPYAEYLTAPKPKSKKVEVPQYTVSPIVFNFEEEEEGADE